MKKKLFLTGLLTTFSLVAKSQVGVNTAAPSATLDVTAKNSTGTGTAVEGILIPRVDRQKAQSMTGVPVSTLIYVNSIATGTNTGTALNIDAVGYYYYNGTVWTKLTNPINIYNADGTLTGNRTVTQGANTLAFTGTQANAFSVDGNTLSVDAANNRVGIGTVSPTSKLVVKGTNAQPSAMGTANTNATFRVDGDTSHSLDFGTYTTTPFGSYISSQNKASAATLPLVLNPAGGNVGIGVNAPTSKLHVEGSQLLNAAVTTAQTKNALDINVGQDGFSYGNRTENFGINMRSSSSAATGPISRINFGDTSTSSATGNRYLSFSVGQTPNELMYLTDANSGRVGIGTTSPSTKVDINGNLRIGTASGSNSSGNVSTLVRDNTTGEVKVATSPTGNTAMFNYITYTLSNVDGDYISDYDTKISTADYSVVVVGIFFTSPLKVIAPGSAQPYFSPSNVLAYQQNSTWHLLADYPNTAPASNGTWAINCLVINNSLIKSIPGVNQDLGGSSTGAAAGPPAGL
ncbi:hypothetical protein LIV57_13960 [Chryseobacterium sp. X308]|uniref:hypothetical protein n=1 Tax=Chryseobacterium sp. X308 TaxID=2884873 RepID=UPI001D154E90|nr:hypothetical protein [Chryseobacterium sp. X308]MCC3216372.1 hypothetical protein [Chryseobacterium sp. X308]